MNFWDLEHSPDACALFEDSGRSVTYGELVAACSEFQRGLGPKLSKRLGVVAGGNTIETAVAYLGGLRCDDAVLPLNTGLDPVLQRRLVEAYQPDWIYHDNEMLLDTLLGLPGFMRVAPHVLRRDGDCPPIHTETAVLMSTSGSTGSPRMARLAARNVNSNAESIRNYLELDETERPVTTLPFYYSYGLSILHSHLLAGAAIGLTDRSLISPEFWGFVSDGKISSLAGVPYTYQMLRRLDLGKRAPGSLRTLTQAGGKLSPELIRYFAQLATERNWRFFVMYGQTEAAPRISYVPHNLAYEKAGAIGIAIPGGALSIDNASGEIVYRGPNVMLGYAECRADLARGDELGGVLHTGDIGYRDADGFFHVTGRLKRFLKIFGNRFNLDELEQLLIAVLGAECAVVGRDDRLTVFVQQEEHQELARNWLVEHARIPVSAIGFRAVPDLPRQGNGKLDYARMTREALEA